MSETQSKNALNKKAFKAGIFYIISQLFVRGITFIMTPVYTRLLSQVQYNQIKIYESWLLIFAPIMSLCLWRSVERAKYDVKERFNEYVSSVQTLSYLSISGFFLLFLIFKEPLERICSMTDFMLYIAFLYTYAHTSIFYFQRREKQMMRYKASTLFTAVTVIPATLLSVLLIYIGKSTGHEDSLVALRIAGYYIPMIIGGFSAAAIIPATQPSGGTYSRGRENMQDIVAFKFSIFRWHSFKSRLIIAKKAKDFCHENTLRCLPVFYLCHRLLCALTA